MTDQTNNTVSIATLHEMNPYITGADSFRRVRKLVDMGILTNEIKGDCVYSYLTIDGPETLKKLNETLPTWSRNYVGFDVERLESGAIKFCVGKYSTGDLDYLVGNVLAYTKQAVESFSEGDVTPEIDYSGFGCADKAEYCEALVTHEAFRNAQRPMEVVEPRLDDMYVDPPWEDTVQNIREKFNNWAKGTVTAIRHYTLRAMYRNSNLHRIESNRPKKAMPDCIPNGVQQYSVNTGVALGSAYAEDVWNMLCYLVDKPVAYQPFSRFIECNYENNMPRIEENLTDPRSISIAKDQHFRSLFWFAHQGLTRIGLVAAKDNTDALGFYQPQEAFTFNIAGRGGPYMTMWGMARVKYKVVIKNTDFSQKSEADLHKYKSTLWGKYSDVFDHFHRYTVAQLSPQWERIITQYIFPANVNMRIAEANPDQFTPSVVEIFHNCRT